jgi:hypothetical protein
MDIPSVRTESGPEGGDGTSSRLGFMTFSCDLLPVLLAPHISARLFCPPVLKPSAPCCHPPLAVLPCSPKLSLPAPTVSATRFPPPVKPPLYCSLSLRLREARHDVEPERRFSARWWPVEVLFQGSKNLRAAGAAAVGRHGCVFAARVEGTCDEAEAPDRLPAFCVSCADRGPSVMLGGDSKTLFRAALRLARVACCMVCESMHCACSRLQERSGCPHATMRMRLPALHEESRGVVELTLLVCMQVLCDGNLRALGS